MAKMGRPKSDNPRGRKISIRMTEEEYRDLFEYMEKHELTATRALLNGFYFMKRAEDEKRR